MKQPSYLMEHEGEGARMELRDEAEARQHLEQAGLRAGDHVLDVGCASGWLTRLIAERTAPGDVVGLDLSPDRIRMARERAVSLGVSRVEFVQGDVAALPFPDARFDVSLSRYTFEYLKSPIDALRELKRVTRPGGRVVVADLDGNGMFHYPIPPQIEAVLQKLAGALGGVGFDPFVGRKLFHLFHQVGFRSIQVQVMPHHLIAGRASERDLENWRTKLRVIRPYALRAFPSEQAYDNFAAMCDELLLAEDSLSYSVTFLVVGIV